jgi:hypothetical protein
LGKKPKNLRMWKQRTFLKGCGILDCPIAKMVLPINRLTRYDLSAIRKFEKCAGKVRKRFKAGFFQPVISFYGYALKALGSASFCPVIWAKA